MSTIAAACIALSLSTHANLPDANMSAKDAAALVLTAAQNLGDNATDDNSDKLRHALATAQSKGLYPALMAAKKLSAGQLKNAGKIIRLADTCALQIFKGPIFVREEIWTADKLSDAYVQDLAKKCAAEGQILRKETPVGGKSTIVPASQ